MARHLEGNLSHANRLFRTYTLIQFAKHSFFATLLCCVYLVSTSEVSAQTNIGGVVNQYVQVTDVVPCDSMLRVGNPANFAVGDLVLIIQMKGAKVHGQNDSAFGTITDMNWAGCAEYLTILKIVDDKFYFGSRLVHTYDPSGNVQLVKVARYTSARVISDIQARPWNGSIGGVIVIEVAEDLTLNANITASEQGFRGGVVSIPYSRCNVGGYLLNWAFGTGGAKGESIAALPVVYQPAGRGALANAGGGGNGNNAGGGGGSNGGVGGLGGSANRHCAEQLLVGGFPGHAIDSLVPKQRFFFGGGGGGGHQNDTLGTSGANGGGIVFVVAKNIYANGFSIQADGQSVVKNAEWDGAGGGGGGGTIYLDAKQIIGSLNLSAKGGNGGSISHMFNAHGPGGGGGGGVIVYKDPVPGTVVSLAGGKRGLHLYPDNEVFGQSWGATDGNPGKVINSFRWKVPADLILTAWGGGPICPGETQTLSASDGFMQYIWSDGSTQQTTTVSKPGTYSVQTIDSSGCIHNLGGLRVWDNQPIYTIASDLNFGTVDYRSPYNKQIVVVNNDDDELVVRGITESANFKVTDPTVFPIRIAPGATLFINVYFFANEDREYSELIEIDISNPCPVKSVVNAQAVVNPIKIWVGMSDTSANTGDKNFSLPVRCTLVPDTLTLPATHLKVTVRFNSKLYAPNHVSVGRIVADNVDLIAQLRTVTVEIDSIDLHGENMVLTEFFGTVLQSVVRESPLEVIDIEWIRVWQNPRTTLEDGHLDVTDVCFQQGRNVKFYSMPRLEVSPNPVVDVMHTTTVLSAPGLYSLKIVDAKGNTVYGQSILHSSEVEEVRDQYLSTTEWNQGLYFVVYSTPLLTLTQQIAIQR